MARLWSTGFELNSATLENITIQGSPTIQNSTVRSGGFASQMTSLSSGTTMAHAMSFLASAGNGPYWFRTYFRYAILPSADNAIVRLGNTATGGTVIGVRLTSTGGLKLFNGASQVGSTSSNLTVNIWYRVEVKIDKTPAGGSQVAELRVDGSVVATSSALTLNNPILSYSVGANMQAEAQTTGNWFFDDIAINDSTGSFQTSYPGTGSIVHIHPNGVGDNTQWIIGGSSPAATNWQSVSEVTPDDGVTLVTATTSGNIDFYTVGSSGVGGSDTVNVVAIGVRQGARATGGTNTALQIKKTTGGTITTGSTFIASASTGTYSTNGIDQNSSTVKTYNLITYQDPDGSAWTSTTLGTMQIGLKLLATSSQQNISTVWALIDYTPGTGPTPNTSVITGFGYDNYLFGKGIG